MVTWLQHSPERVEDEETLLRDHMMGIGYQ